MLIGYVLLGLAFLSVALNLWQSLAASRFPIRVKRGIKSSPPLSILKPLKGSDSQTELCLRSWFEQDYDARIELLFGVTDESDPACAIVRKLCAEFPQRKVKIVICHPSLGPNGKVSKLAYLASVASHEYLVISDADVEISRAFLAQLVEPFSRDVALVNCFYILRPLSFPMAIEAVAVNADFWSQVLQGLMLKPMDFALGAVMATTRTQLKKIGGFESLLGYLADDYQLGNRIAKSGGRLEICPTPVTCWNDEQSWRDVWNHQLRWARTIRVCQPLPYFLSILSNATFWPLLACLATPQSIAVIVLQAALLLRALTAKLNYQRLTGDNGWIAFGLASLKDLCAAVIWALAFTGNIVTWRGEHFRVDKGGKLTRIA